MKKALIATVLCLFCLTLPAHAANTTYRFRGVVEYGPGPGIAPTYEPEQGSFAYITVTLDKNAVATTTADTATYSGGEGCGPNPDPIVAITVKVGTYSDPYVGPGICDQVVIKRNVNGLYSITIQNNQFHFGTTFTATFVSASANAVPSFAIPEKIDTSSFERSMFTAIDGGNEVFSGDMASRGIQPPP